MLYHLFYPLAKYSILFNVFRYVSFRSIGAFITALFVTLLFGPSFISFLRKKKAVESIDEDVPEKHRIKAGTPTMGGVMILFALLISSLFWNILTNPAVLMMYLSTLWLGSLGFLDDYLKNFVKVKKGLLPKYKLWGQISGALILTLIIYFSSPETDITNLQIPFFKNLILPLGWFFIPFVVFMITGSSNAVNLTDGLDGLASGVLAIAAFGLGVMSYIKGNFVIAGYLNLEFIQNAGELAVFTSALVGALMGFLWYNSYPAQIFMGDTGSLALGGIMAVISVLIKEPFFLMIIGFLFVVETFSVIIQRYWFKYTRKKYGAGRRVFLCAPIHHHYELKGLHETKIVMRFYIVAMLLVAVALSTIKLR